MPTARIIVIRVAERLHAPFAPLIHRLRDRGGPGLSLDLSAVVVYVHGVEDPRTGEILRLAGALGVEPGSFFAGLESFGRVDRDERIAPSGDVGAGEDRK